MHGAQRFIKELLVLCTWGTALYKGVIISITTTTAAAAATTTTTTTTATTTTTTTTTTTITSGNSTFTSGLLLGRSEVLRRLRYYLRTQNPGHNTIDRLEERGVNRGSARRPSVKGREKAVVNQTNIGTVSKTT